MEQRWSIAFDASGTKAQKVDLKHFSEQHAFVSPMFNLNLTISKRQ